MSAPRVAGHRTKRFKIHAGWLQAELPSPPPEREQPDSESTNSYLPANDPCLSGLIGRLQGDYPLASAVTFFAGASEWSGGGALASLLHTDGWLLVTRHRLRSRGVVTEHFVSTGRTSSGPISLEMCLHLTTCSFDRSGVLEAPDTIVGDLLERARRIGTQKNLRTHQQQVKAAAPLQPQAIVSVPDLDRKLDAIERQAAKVRKRIAAIPFKTEEYRELDRELTGIVQEFHATLRQRRELRRNREKEQLRSAKRDQPVADELRETLEPVVLVRWKLEP